MAFEKVIEVLKRIVFSYKNVIGSVLSSWKDGLQRHSFISLTALALSILLLETGFH